MPPPPLLTRGDALAAGMTDGQIRARLASGAWLRMASGIYVASSAATPESLERLRIRAAITRMGRLSSSAAVASHESAARLHGIALLAAAHPGVVLTRPGRAYRYRDLEVHRSSVEVDELQEIEGVPATSASRTVADIARARGLRAGVVAADSALRQGKVTLARLLSEVQRHETWPGSLTAARTVDLSDPASESPLETLSRLALREQGLPAPVTQFEVRDEAGVFVGRVDFCWPTHHVIGEADGRSKYTDPSVLWAEKRREDRLRDLGFEVVRWGWEITRAPWAVAGRIRVAFERARRHTV